MHTQLFQKANSPPRLELIATNGAEALFLASLQNYLREHPLVAGSLRNAPIQILPSPPTPEAEKDQHA